MLRWLKRKIAWAVAGRELAELERWRVEWSETRRWLAEFEDVADALDHMQSFVIGRQYDGLANLRVAMRRRRDHERKFDEALASLVPNVATGAELDRLAMRPVMSDAQIAEFKRQWRAVDHPLVDLRSAAVLDAVDQHMADMREFENSVFVDPPAPTHFSGIAPGRMLNGPVLSLHDPRRFDWS